ncbi:MAG TPA: hypothetical protein DHW71_05475, partial [Gammaproteobacteria bacterium]|nr:hypothetical protein [Gammaproteobacteria bacterium]
MAKLRQNFMDINWKLLSRERKLWRVVDEAATHRTFYISLAQLPFYLWLYFASPYAAQHPLFWVSMTLFGTFVLCMRGFMFYRFDAMHGRSPVRWRQFFMLMNIVHMAYFASTILGLCLVHPMPSIIIFAIMLSLLHAILLLGAFAPFQYGVVLLLVSHIGPFIALSLIGYDLFNVMTGILLTLGVLALMFEGKKLTQFLWSEQKLRRDHRNLKRELKNLQERHSGEQHLSNEFLASLSREIRTPMNNVLGMLRLLSETELSVEQRRMQNIATASGENIVMLVDELMDLSNIIGHKLVLDSAVFNIRQCIDATINLLSPMAYAKNTELTHISDPDIPLRVRGDARRISQVLSNVISFVIDYTEGGEISVNVHLTPAQVVEGILRIHISSKNAMIPEKVHDEVQQLLNQHESIETLSPNHLGLEIAKGVIEAMRGNIGFVASGKNGVTFWVTMHITLSTQQTFQSKTPPVFYNKRVLLIDMTPGLVTSIRNDAESWNMHVTSIQGYQKALELMRAEARDGNSFDVAILNMSLEYVGSLKLSTLMAEDPILKDVKQIILCTVTQRGQSATLKHEGKDIPCLFLTKPFSRGNLYFALLELLDAETEHEGRQVHGFDETMTGNEMHRILLVEDNKVNQMVALGMLKKLGYAADVCDTGLDALEKLKKNRYDLVLLDCNLPDTDGYSITEEYRKYEQEHTLDSNQPGVLHRTAVIALTANVSEGEEARCFAAGMDDYLTKPIQADKMAIRLRTWLEKAPVQSGVIHTQHASKNAESWSSLR